MAFVLLAVTSARARPRDLGVDISHHQGESGISQATWNQIAAEGSKFAFIKATEGLSGADDPAMASNLARATSAGILNGVYHYAHAENRPTPAGAVLEANHFLAYAGAAIGPGHLRPVIEVEGSNSRLDAIGLTNWVIAFINRVVEVRGPSAEPIIYTNAIFTDNKFDPRIANYDLWIYEPNPAYDPFTGNPDPSSLGHFPNWSFWQYNVTGNLAGISPLDLDVVHSEYKPLASYLIVPEPSSIALALAAILACSVPLAHWVEDRPRRKRG
ncbi:MAG: glycoside hydrolase family 25 protein [Planctomycetaceae bacterium]